MYIGAVIAALYILGTDPVSSHFKLFRIACSLPEAYSKQTPRKVHLQNYFKGRNQAQQHPVCSHQAFPACLLTVIVTHKS